VEEEIREREGKKLFSLSSLFPLSTLLLGSVLHETSQNKQLHQEMSFAADDSSPISSLPSSSSSESDSSEYRAPLNGEAPEPSIDGTSVTGGEGGLRASSAEEVDAESKKVSWRFSAPGHYRWRREELVSIGWNEKPLHERAGIG